MPIKDTDEKETPRAVRPSRAETSDFAQAITTGSREAQYADIVAVAKELFLEKNEQYKDSISRTGLIGSVVAIAGISARLEHLVLGSLDAGKSEEEAIKDIIKDLLNYAVISGMMIMDGNWRP